jgi:hypothetical protein
MADNDKDPPPPLRPHPWVPNQSDDSPRMRPAQSNASLYGPATFDVVRTAETAALTGRATIQAKATVTVEAEVIYAPFREAGIAERLASNPEFYSRYAAHVAFELRVLADSIDTQGQANADHAIKGRVTEVADAFDEAASTLATQNGILKPAVAQKAAAIVSKIRDTYVALCLDHPEILQIAAIGLAGYALHQIGGVSADLAALISYAVIKKEKLTEIFSTQKDKGKGRVEEK